MEINAYIVDNFYSNVDEVRDELFSNMKTLTEEPMNFEGDE